MSKNKIELSNKDAVIFGSFWIGMLIDMSVLILQIMDWLKW